MLLEQQWTEELDVLRPAPPLPGSPPPEERGKEGSAPARAQDFSRLKKLRDMADSGTEHERSRALKMYDA